VKGARRFRTVTAGPVLVVVLALAGCGISPDSHPQALPRDAVPFGLLSGSTTTSSTTPTSTTTTSPQVANEVLVHVYLLDTSGHLVSLDRLILLPLGAGLDALLDQLFAGPTPAEAVTGFQTAIPAQTKVVSSSITGGLATVNLNAAFGQVVGPAQVQAVAQMVYTATDQSGVTSVAFELSGQPVSVPVSSGAQLPVVDRSQFSALAPHS
jgi:hypothetical protein